MVTFAVVIFFLLVVLLDFRAAFKEKEKTEIWFYAFCLFLSFIILLLKSLNITLPGPTQPIMEALRALSLIE